MEVKEKLELFCVALDSQHPCIILGVATKDVALNACIPLKSSRLTLPFWSLQSQGTLRSIFCDNHVSTSVIFLCSIF